jgi:hypothetical protein
MGPKDLPPSISTLRPIDGTSDAIRDALSRLRAARSENTDAIARLEASRPQMLLTAAPAQIDQVDQDVRQRRIFAEQLDLLEPELKRMAGEAITIEEDQKYVGALAEVTARAEAWNAKFQAEYPTWCAAIQPLFDEEKEIEAAIRAMTEMPGARRAQPNVADNFFYASRIMLRHSRHSMSQGVRFGKAVLRPPIAEDAP